MYDGKDKGFGKGAFLLEKMYGYARLFCIFLFAKIKWNIIFFVKLYTGIFVNFFLYELNNNFSNNRLSYIRLFSTISYCEQNNLILYLDFFFKNIKFQIR